MNPEPGVDSFEVAMPEGFTFGTMNVADSSAHVPQPAAKNMSATVEIQAYAPNAVTLSVVAPSEGYVVLCDAYYPRWRARVNGEEVKVLRANSTVRAVPVTEGENFIEFSYDASSFRRAGWVRVEGRRLTVVDREALERLIQISGG